MWSIYSNIIVKTVTDSTKSTKFFKTITDSIKSTQIIKNHHEFNEIHSIHQKPSRIQSNPFKSSKTVTNNQIHSNHQKTSRNSIKKVFSMWRIFRDGKCWRTETQSSKNRHVSVRNRWSKKRSCGHASFGKLITFVSWALTKKVYFSRKLHFPILHLKIASLNLGVVCLNCLDL